MARVNNVGISRQGQLQFGTWKIFFSIYVLMLFATTSQAATIITAPLNKEDAVCTTKACIEFAHLIRDNLDETVDPCTNFYDYACGKKSITKAIPSPKLVLKAINKILTEDIAATDNKVERWVKTQYKSCVGQSETGDTDIAYFFSVMNGTGIAWPMITSKHGTDYHVDWLPLHDYYHRILGEGSLFTVNVRYANIYVKSAQIHLSMPIDIMLPTFSKRGVFSAEYYAEIVARIAKQFAKASNSSITYETFIEDAKDVFHFRQDLERINVALDDDAFGKLRSSFYKISIESWDKFEKNKTNFTASLDWLQILQNTFRDISMITLDNQEEIRVHDPEYIHQLSTLLAHTPIRTILNHIHLYFVEQHLEYIPTLKKSLVEQTQDDTFIDRHEMCALLPTLMPFVNSMYVKRYFPEYQQESAVEVVNRVKDTLRNLILRTTWINKMEKEEAAAKLTNIFQVIGASNWYRDESKIINYYAQYNYTSNYIENLFIRESTHYKQRLGSLRKFIDILHIARKQPINTDMQFSVVLNKLEIPAASLHLPHFDADLPRIVNYAVLGADVGREISGAVNSFGMLVDHNAQIKYWLGRNSSQTYLLHQKCIRSQVNATDDGLNSILSDFASFHDNTALFTAYEMYTELANEVHLHKMERLPTLSEFTNVEMFFLAYATRWCDASREGSSWRLNSALSNLPEFGNAFKCASGTPMNPKKKCKIWG